MRRPVISAVAAPNDCAWPAPTAATAMQGAALSDAVPIPSMDMKPYEEIYKQLHCNPELSNQEAETSALVIRELTKPGGHYKIVSKINKHGLVGILKNGTGPTVMLRADMDALPVKEETGLSYASTKTMKRESDGKLVPVMHACGHDVHVTCLLAAAKLLLGMRASWSGTLLVLFQPAEELVGGAQGMVDDGLYTRHAVPIPDIVLGQHVLPFREGSVGACPGTFLSEASSYSIRIFGRGGHATTPQQCIDPVLAAAHTVVRLNSIVSREVKPGELAVLSVCSITGGSTGNVIPDYADLKLTTRSYSEDVHRRLDQSLRRIVAAECNASGCETPPQITRTSHTPATRNDPTAAQSLNAAFKKHFDARHSYGRPITMPAMAGSEDFPVLALAVGKPYVFWGIGGIKAEQWDKAEKEGKLDLLPSNHSSKFAPVIEPTLRVGTEALVVAALNWLGSKNKN